MSLNSLLESANPYQSMQSDAARLSSKWAKTGLLEGLEGSNKNNMGIILENQAKQLVVESSQTGGGAASSGTFQSQTAVNTGGQWAGVALPLVRKVFGQIAAKEFVSVQPMNLPSGLVFFLDFQYGSDKTPFAKGSSLYGDAGANAPFGNDAEGGLYGAGRFGYSINNTQSVETGLVAVEADWNDLNYDSDYSSSFGDYWKIKVPLADLEFVDSDGVAAFQLVVGNSAVAYKQAAAGVQLSAFTKVEGVNVEFIALKTDTGAADISEVAALNFAIVYQIQPTDQFRGDFEDGNPEPNSLNFQQFQFQKLTYR